VWESCVYYAERRQQAFPAAAGAGQASFGAAAEGASLVGVVLAVQWPVLIAVGCSCSLPWVVRCRCSIGGGGGRSKRALSPDRSVAYDGSARTRTCTYLFLLFGGVGVADMCS
jgi:hypothetical protein